MHLDLARSRAEELDLNPAQQLDLTQAPAPGERPHSTPSRLDELSQAAVGPRLGLDDRGSSGGAIGTEGTLARSHPEAKVSPQVIELDGAGEKGFLDLGVEDEFALTDNGRLRRGGNP
jgi:hypothetical protein